MHTQAQQLHPESQQLHPSGQHVQHPPDPFFLQPFLTSSSGADASHKCVAVSRTQTGSPQHAASEHPPQCTAIGLYAVIDIIPTLTAGRTVAAPWWWCCFAIGAVPGRTNDWGARAARPSMVKGGKIRERDPLELLELNQGHRD